MIISFTVENWMSFCDSVSFSMVASRERQHGERVPKIAKFQTRILPIAAIYGGNASGKTNFFLALNFVKGFVLKGISPDSNIPVKPYRLDSAKNDNPSRFILELLIDEIIYEFSFAVTRKEVVEEKLVQITSSGEKILYFRQGEMPNFDPKLDKDQFLHFAFRGTRDNQLFLTNSVSQKVEIFKPVYDWFKDTLELIAPDSRFEPFENFLDEDNLQLYSTVNEMLKQLDTGISRLNQEEIPFENVPFPESLKSKLQEDVKENGTDSVRVISPTNEGFVITRRAGELVAKKLVTYHSRSDGTDAKFDIHQESDGTQRVIHLLPALLEVSAPKSKKVYIIDEVDRSLHTLLVRQFIEAYLAKCNPESRVQLLITTHDVLLMDQGLFRRDEMWLTERNHKGSTELFSLSDYKDIRYDKDIRKSYLQGRFGGIPRILFSNAQTV